MATENKVMAPAEWIKEVRAEETTSYVQMLMGEYTKYYHLVTGEQAMTEQANSTARNEAQPNINMLRIQFNTWIDKSSLLSSDGSLCNAIFNWFAERIGAQPNGESPLKAARNEPTKELSAEDWLIANHNGPQHQVRFNPFEWTLMMKMYAKHYYNARIPQTEAPLPITGIVIVYADGAEERLVIRQETGANEVLQEAHKMD